MATDKEQAKAIYLATCIMGSIRQYMALDIEFHIIPAFPDIPNDIMDDVLKDKYPGILTDKDKRLLEKDCKTILSEVKENIERIARYTESIHK